VLSFIACGSSKRSGSNNYHQEKTEERKTEASSRIQAQSATGIKTETTVNTNLSGFTRITNYNDSGGVSSVQESWWGARSDKLELGTVRSSDVSLTEEIKKDTTAIRTNTDIKSVEKTEKDNRPLQGSEWLYIIIPVLIALNILIIVIYKKVKKK